MTATIAAFVGVKDELGLIGHCIGHLRQIGVDKIIACDMGSTDGSLELMRELGGPDLKLITLDDSRAGDLEQWPAIAAGEIRASGADWGMFLDADEFWLPTGGNLKSALARENADILKVRRFNVILTQSGPAISFPVLRDQYDSILLAVREIPEFRRKFEDGLPIAWLLNVPVPKIIARSESMEQVSIGGHDVQEPPGRKARRGVASGIVIAHLPFSTGQRFARKVGSLARMFQAHDRFFGERLAWHWRQWANLQGEDEIAREFAKQVLGDPIFREMRQEQAIKSVAELLG